MKNEPLPRANVETVVVTVESKYSSGTRTYVLGEVGSIEVSEWVNDDGSEDLTLSIRGARLI